MPGKSKYGFSASGLSYNPARSIWFQIMMKSFVPIDKGYRAVGALGLGAPESWKDMTIFLQDVGERPGDYWLARKDVHLPYSKENCHWVPPNDVKRKHIAESRFGVIGKKFGKWTAESLHLYPQRGRNERYYYCRCECGNTAEVNSSDLRRLSNSQCRHCGIEASRKYVVEKMKNEWIESQANEVGKTFGKWTVICGIDRLDKYGYHLYLCRCVCGKEAVRRRTYLLTGQCYQCQSCGGRQGAEKRRTTKSIKARWSNNLCQ